MEAFSTMMFWTPKHLSSTGLESHPNMADVEAIGRLPAALESCPYKNGYDPRGKSSPDCEIKITELKNYSVYTNKRVKEELPDLPKFSPLRQKKKNPGRSNRRPNRGIVEECCFRSCDLDLLETYCAKPVKNERDLSTAPASAMPSLNKDIYHKHSHKYSKYDIWQRKSTQRLRRGVPAIVRARQYRWRVQQIEETQQLLEHRPLTTLPAKQPYLIHQDSDPSHD
ncbi:unnamed protein product [Ranitomeya imitator]|uniref:Insulin-like growth factor 2 n=1 Tax=Ranitomeya imitator TaxID=111125 RepID=A0ABN9M4P3_9NEOB|nr:unnamed protein product [Ranitomeya imitator]